MEISTDKKELLNLIKQAHDGELVLPQFQRNFVWSRGDIEDLLKSLIKGYFIGSFLLLRVDKDNLPFAMRSIAGVNKKNEELKPDYMILDGQQRITALYYCIYEPKNVSLKNAKHPYKFFLDLKKLNEEEIDESVWSDRKKYCEKYNDIEKQFEDLQLPLSQVKNWEHWKTEYTRWLQKNKSEEDLYNFIGKIEPLWTNYINNIRNKLIPYIEIPKVKDSDEKGISEVCAIFEKMNSTGVDLGVYDLLTARLYKYREYNIDIHKLWKETINENDLINYFSNKEPDSYGIFILRIIALIRKIDPKSKNIINLKPENFKEDWKTASTYLEKALKRINSTNSSGFGVFEKKWFPYPPMVSVLAALLWFLDKNKLSNECYSFIKKWYWGSIFSERYSSAVESKTQSDFINLTKKFKDASHQIKIFDEFERNFSTLKLIGVTSRSNAKYKGVMNLIALMQAKDFRKYDSIEFHQLDDHHIFPVKYLMDLKDENNEKKYNSDKINSILNKTLISSDTNKIINKLSPEKYIKEIIPPDKLKIIMNSHFINEVSLAHAQNNNYDLFLLSREHTILSKIKELGGFISDIEKRYDTNKSDIIFEFEKDMRKFIDEVLSDEINTNWWKTIPSNIKETVDKKITQIKNKDPTFKEENFSNGIDKLNLTDFEHLRQIITSKWNDLFIKYFKGTAEDFTMDFKNILNLRNKLAHSNIPESHIKNLGIGSLEKLNISIQKVINND